MRAGVYVGVYGRRVRERIWEEVKTMIDGGNAVITWATPNDSGFTFEYIGENRREPADFDGLTLVKFKPVPTPVVGPVLSRPNSDAGKP